MLFMHVLERSTLGSILLYHPIFVYSRQGMDNFNQPLSFDTSSVTDMFGMFQVRSPAGAQLELLHHPFVYSRQDAYKFNQPLSFDTSSVTSMTEMFKVRALPCTPSARPTPRTLSCALFATLGRAQTPCPPPTSCSSVAHGRKPRPSPPLAMARLTVTRAGLREAARERSSARVMLLERL